MTDALITKYRPTQLSDVIGQKAVVRSLLTNLEKKSSNTFLFSGPPGTGKTTLARIAADLRGCPAKDIVEVDGATTTGIDDMRAVTSTLMYKPVGGGSKAIIIDEAQGLSKSAITSLLKTLEEPPPWVLWALCTTEPARIPVAILSRCTHYSLKEVPFDELAAFLDGIAAKEGLDIAEDIVDLCAAEAGGSPRQALANLSACAAAKSLGEAKELLRSAISSEEAVNLARLLVQRGSWSDAQKVLAGLKDTNPESLRHVVRAYVTKVALGAKAESQFGQALEILSEFSEPFHPADGISPIVLATGRVLLK